MHTLVLCVHIWLDCMRRIMRQVSVSKLESALMQRARISHRPEAAPVVSCTILWIRVKVLVCCKLRGVDVDGDHHYIALFLGNLNQAHVPAVKEAHGGHKADAVALNPLVPRPAPHLGFLLNQEHGETGRGTRDFGAAQSCSTVGQPIAGASF